MPLAVRNSLLLQIFLSLLEICPPSRSAKNVTGRKKSEIIQIKLSNHEPKFHTASKPCTKLQNQVFFSCKIFPEIIWESCFPESKSFVRCCCQFSLRDRLWTWLKNRSSYCSAKYCHLVSGTFACVIKHIYCYDTCEKQKNNQKPNQNQTIHMTSGHL